MSASDGWVYDAATGIFIAEELVPVPASGDVHFPVRRTAGIRKRKRSRLLSVRRYLPQRADKEPNFAERELTIEAIDAVLRSADEVKGRETGI